MDFENLKLKISPLKSRTGIDVDGKSLADIWGEDISGISDHNGVARRIVAAWNACNGIETELLETLPLNFKAHALQCADLRTKNAALLAAVEEMRRMLPVVEYLQISRLWETANQGENASLENYRATLEKALEAVKNDNQ